MYLHKILPINELQEGDKPKLIIKGENPIHDTIIKNVFKLSDKTNVFHCNTNELILPIGFIGGREARAIGDTCRMFFKVHISDRPADYYFWDGIVQGNLKELDNYITEEQMFTQIFTKEVLDTDQKLQDVGLMQYTNDFGLATGKTNYRIVLIEKVPFK